MRLILATLVALGGCVSHSTGVRERVVAAVPAPSLAIAGHAIPSPGSIRVGTRGTAAPTTTTSPTVSEGQTTSSALAGELYVGVGMPGGTHEAGWELVGGATARPSDALAHAQDPTLAIGATTSYGGYVQIDAAVHGGNTTGTIAFAVRESQIAYAWDYGDCAGGHACAYWNRKGEVASEQRLGTGAGGSLAFFTDVGPHWAAVYGAAFDVRPSIAASTRGDVLCDGNGMCTGGASPTPPRPDVTYAGQLFFGADASLGPLRASAILVYAKHPDDDAGSVQLHGGVEVRF